MRVRSRLQLGWIAVIVAVGLGLDVPLTTVSDLFAADPDVYMSNLLDRRGGGPDPADVQQLVDRIDGALESGEAQVMGSELVAASPDPGASAIRAHAAAEGWTATLSFLRELLVHLCP